MWQLNTWHLGILVAAIGLPVRSQSCSVSEWTAAPSDADPGDEFGSAVAFDGDTLLVGAPRDEGTGMHTGAAYVFARTAGRWQQQAKLVGSDVTADALFGTSVAVEGDTAVVGAWNQDGLQGAVYMFQRVGSSWTEQHKLVHRWQDGTRFGTKVELHGDLLVVSAPAAFTLQPPAFGSLSVFRRAGTEWTVEAELFLPGASLLHSSDIGLTDRRIAASYHASPGVLAVYEAPAGTWELQELLETELLAASVALERDTLLAGFPSIGEVEVFDLVTIGPGARYWLHTHSIVEAAPAFGRRIDALGATALVGAPTASHGSAWVYRRSHNQEYSLAGTLVQPTAADIRFGAAVAIGNSDTFAVGEEPTTGSGTPGAAYVMGFADLPSSYCTAKPNSLGCVASMDFEGLPSASASSGFVVTAAPVRNKKLGLLLYGVDGAAAVPFQGGTLCIRAPLERTSPVSSRGNPPPFNDCSGVLTLDMNAFAAGVTGGKPLAELRRPGAEVVAQWWSRDPGAPFDTGLSDALRFVVCN